MTKPHERMDGRPLATDEWFEELDTLNIEEQIARMKKHVQGMGMGDVARFLQDPRVSAWIEKHHKAINASAGIRVH